MVSGLTERFAATPGDLRPTFWGKVLVLSSFFSWHSTPDAVSKFVHQSTSDATQQISKSQTSAAPLWKPKNSHNPPAIHKTPRLLWNRRVNFRLHNFSTKQTKWGTVLLQLVRHFLDYYEKWSNVTQQKEAWCGNWILTTQVYCASIKFRLRTTLILFSHVRLRTGVAPSGQIVDLLNEIIIYLPKASTFSIFVI